MPKPSLPRDVRASYYMALCVLVATVVYPFIFHLDTIERGVTFSLLGVAAIVCMLLARRYSLQERRFILLSKLEPALVALYKEVQHPETPTIEDYLKWRLDYLGLHGIQIVIEQAEARRLPELASTSISSDAYSRVATVLNEIRESVR